MQKTEHYQLNQWDAGDRVLREDFNADNAKIDAAIAQAAQGNCQIVTGSYIGTGTYNSNQNQLNFSKQPLALFIAGNGHTGIGIAGNYAGFCVTDTGGSTRLNFTWNADGTVQWYATTNAAYQLNTSGVSYIYFALFQ